MSAVARSAPARACGEAVRRLRSLTGLPLADLVGEAERALGLDIEVLARPEHTPATARAHLDAFADVAATLRRAAPTGPRSAGSSPGSTPRVDEERGLDMGTIEVRTDAVQVLTVHAAKGLEWDVVAVPGLVEGSFPARVAARARRHKDGQWRAEPADRQGLAAAGCPACPTTCAATATGCRARLAARARPARRWATRPSRFVSDGGRARHRRGAPAGLRRAHPGPLRAAAHRARCGATRRPRG